MVRLNEIRTSNLNKLKNSTYFNVAKSYPKELLRLLHEAFRDAGFEVNEDETIQSIDRFERDMNDSLSNSNWFLDSNNSREIKINDDIAVRLEPKQEFVKFAISTAGLWGGISLKFDYTDKVGKILDKIINFTKEATSKLDMYSSLEKKQKVRQELKLKYGENDKPKFINSLERLFSKFGFYLKRDSRDKIIYKFNYDYESIFPNIGNYITHNLENEFKDTNMPFKINMLQNKIYPILIKKIENNNYLLKDYRMLNDYYYLELTDKKKNQKYPGANLTYGERHEKVKSVMFDRNEENLKKGREAQRELVKGLLE